MSKLDKIAIQLGDETIEVPAWATETTAKKLSKHSEATAKAVTELLKLQNSNNKVATQNKKLFTDIEKNMSVQTFETTRTRKATEKSAKKTDQSNRMQANAAKKLNEASKGLVSSIAKGDLKAFAIAAGSIMGLSTAFGFAAGLVEDFSKNLTHLTNTGVGFGTTLTDLRHDAAQAGMGLENYGKILSTNSEAINALGTSTSEGARMFSQLSAQLRGVNGELGNTARQFNQFGLSNKEYNEILAEEIDLRRRAGMSAVQIQDSLSESMNELLLETTKMASMTGQDRREMLRNRQTALKEPIAEAFRMRLEMDGEKLSENFGHIASVLGRGGEAGQKFASAIMSAISTEQDIAAVQQGLFAELSNIGGANVNQSIREVFEFARDNYADMPTDEFTRKLTALTADVADSVSSQDLDNLGRLASAGNQAAGEILGMIGEFNGLSNSVEANRQSQEQAEDYVRNMPLLALASSLEDLEHSIKASALDTVFGRFDEDFMINGQNLVDNIRLISDSFGDGRGMFEGFVDLFDKVETFGKIVMGATAALVAFTAVLSVRGLLPGIRLPRGGGARPSGGATGGRVPRGRTPPGLPRSGVPATPSNTTGILKGTGRTVLGTAGRAIPWLGAGLMASSAMSHASDGNWLRAGVEGIGAAGSLIPGAGIPIALGTTALSHGIGRKQDGVPASEAQEEIRNMARGRLGIMSSPSPEATASPSDSIIKPPTFVTEEKSVEDNLPQNRTAPGQGTDYVEAMRQMIREMSENNRLLRRQTDAIEAQD